MLSIPRDTEFWLARSARAQAQGVDALYHGTRYPAAILEAGALMPARIGDPVVCFSRSAEAAACLAVLPRDDDEGRGAIFIFERRRLMARHRLYLHDDKFDHPEFEERVWDELVNLNGALVGFVSEPFLGRSQRERMRVREHIVAVHEFKDW